MEGSKRIQEIFPRHWRNLRGPQEDSGGYPETFWRSPKIIQEKLKRDLVGAPGNHVGIAA